MRDAGGLALVVAELVAALLALLAAPVLLLGPALVQENLFI